MGGGGVKRGGVVSRSEGMLPLENFDIILELLRVS